MSLIQPKPFLDRFKLRNKAQGIERRRNMSKMILENGTPFPLAVTYEDIDNAFFNWVDKDLDISYNGKRFPTYKLFSNQRLSEYSQTWQNVDESGSLVLNFKTITRDNNPQHGESQGSNYNIPGNRDYPMFFVPVLQENGEEAYDMYSMKQPVSVNMTYTVSIITNKYEMLNRFNEMIQTHFSSLECYISPNNHPMPMLLDSINDESEYTIDDRKFYAQSFQIRILAYIIQSKDYTVTRLPSRFIVRFIDNEEKKKKRDSKYDLKVEKNNNLPTDNCKTGLNEGSDIIHRRTDIVMKEDDLPINECKNIDDKSYNKYLEYRINIENCDSSVTFTMDNDMVITEIQTDNIYDFRIHINGELTKVNEYLRLYKEDSINIKITRDDIFKDSLIVFIGYDPTKFAVHKGKLTSTYNETTNSEVIELVKEHDEDKESDAN